MDIYLLRHGETDWNREGLLQGHTDISLNEKGRLQVKDTVKKLSGLETGIDYVVSSPLKRALESAEIAAVLLDYPKERIGVEKLLIERGFGDGEGLSIEERAAKYPDCNYPGMESQEELVKRAGQAFWKIVKDCQGAHRILLVAHGAVLFALLEAVAEKPIPHGGRAAALTQGSLYRIRLEDGRIGFAGYDEKTGDFVEMDEAQLGRLAKIYM
ncbi:MAG: histidine phosphatase family protein [Lachnospiraceae bacterium]|nr:histidine phosphatase family protein [Lachnospiraceae bacterium]